MSKSKLIDTKERVKLLMNRDSKLKSLTKSASHGLLMKKIEQKIQEMDEEYLSDPEDDLIKDKFDIDKVERELTFVRKDKEINDAFEIAK